MAEDNARKSELKTNDRALSLIYHYTQVFHHTRERTMLQNVQTGDHAANESTKVPWVAERLATECKESREDFQALMEDVGTSLGDYCRKRPMVAGLSVLAVGFYLGWKLRP